MSHVDPRLGENIPGEREKRKSPLGELIWVYTAISEAIAWTTMTNSMFRTYLRQDMLLASLVR